MFDNFYVNLRKNEGFLTDIPCIPIPDYGQSKAPLKRRAFKASKYTIIFLLVSLKGPGCKNNRIAVS